MKSPPLTHLIDKYQCTIFNISGMPLHPLSTTIQHIFHRVHSDDVCIFKILCGGSIRTHGQLWRVNHSSGIIIGIIVGRDWWVVWMRCLVGRHHSCRERRGSSGLLVRLVNMNVVLLKVLLLSRRTDIIGLSVVSPFSVQIDKTS